MEVRECTSCKSLDPIALHNVPYRGSFSLLCTACVLRHHAGSFCPLCFDVYEDAPAASKRPANQSLFMCLRCPAMAHLTCIPSARSSSTFRFICPPCSDPSFKFFDVGPDYLTSREIGKKSGAKDFPKQLLCAAKISSASMRRAASIARTNAELRVGEAVAARKRAQEAIEMVARLMDNQKPQNGSNMDMDVD